MNPRIAAFASLVASMILIISVIVYSNASSATGTTPSAPPQPLRSSLDELKQLVEMRDKERIAKLGPKGTVTEPVAALSQAAPPQAAATPVESAKPQVWNPKLKRYGNYSRYQGRLP